MCLKNSKNLKWILNNHSILCNNKPKHHQTMYRSHAPSMLMQQPASGFNQPSRNNKRGRTQRSCTTRISSYAGMGNGHDSDDEGETLSQENIAMINASTMKFGEEILVQRVPILQCLRVPREKLFCRFRPPIPAGWMMPVKEAGLGYMNQGRKSLGMSRNRTPPSMLGEYKSSMPTGVFTDPRSAQDAEDWKKYPDYVPCYLYDPDHPPNYSDNPDDEEEENSSNNAQEAKAEDEKVSLFDLLTKKQNEPKAKGKKKIPKGTTTVIVAPIIGRFLREHQREGVKFLFECVSDLRPYHGQGCILADDMGLGKTLQSITLIYTLLRQGIDGAPTGKRVIVVTPTALVRNWENEVQKWLSGRVRCAALVGSGREEIMKTVRCFLGGAYEVLVISYDTFRLYSNMFEVDDACDLLICDEAHRLKNDATQTSVALDKLKCRRRVLLSGTPLQNDLEEFFAMVNFCNPEVLGSVSYFRKHYQNPILIGREPDATETEVAKSNERSAELSKIVNMFILRRTNTLLAKHLPPKITQIVCVKMTKMQEDMYNHLIQSKEIKSCYKEDAISAQSLASINALKKLCNHPQLLYEKESRYSEPGAGGARKDSAGQQIIRDLTNSFFNDLIFNESSTFSKRASTAGSGGPSFLNASNVAWSGKFLLVANMLEVLRKETDERMVIVSNYTQTLDVFGILCSERNYPYVRLDGSTTPKKRQALVDRLNNPKDDVFVFLLSSRAGGCGLNMIGANRLILFDPDWNPATDKQAAARVWRDGQKKRCYVYRFFSTGTIDEKIYQRQLSKEGLQGVVAEDISMESAISSETLKELFKYANDTRSDTHDKYKCGRCHREEVGEEDGVDGCDEPAVKKQKGVDCSTHAEHEIDARIPKRDKAPVKPDADQIGYPGEGDLNDWGHHSDVDSVDDWVLRKSVANDKELVSFVFSQKIDGAGLARQAMERASLAKAEQESGVDKNG